MILHQYHYFFSNEVHYLRPTADAILKLPFIQNAIMELVEFNKKQIEEIPLNKQNYSSNARQDKKGGNIAGRGRLLSLNLVSTNSSESTNNNRSTAIKSKSENTLKSTQNANNVTVIKTKVDNDKSIARGSNPSSTQKKGIREI